MVSGVLLSSAEQCADQCASEGSQLEHGGRTVGRTSHTQRNRQGQYSLLTAHARRSIPRCFIASRFMTTVECPADRTVDCMRYNDIVGLLLILCCSVMTAVDILYR